MTKNLQKMKEDGIAEFQEQVVAAESSTSHMKSLDDMLFSSKGNSQIELARNKVQEQKRNPRYILPYKRIDTRSVPSLDPTHIKLRNHLHERVNVMIKRTDNKPHALDFPLGIMPGDSCDFWFIPVDEVISIPRGVVLHLKNNCSWVKIQHKEKNAAELKSLPDLSLSTNIVVDSIHTDFNIIDARAL